MTQARFELDDYTARVLDVIKGKFGLKNRNEALQKFAIEKGSEYVEPTPNPMVLKELDAISEAHMKKYGRRSMTDKELDRILSLD
ncbi:MAG: DUF2683 family protein [Nanoarchaeota archaeon]|nr:DUF2683 family protein [Nanoarchaeota archaeon]